MIRTGDLPSGALGLALAAAVCYAARGMPMGTIAQPGAGFLPFWAGVALGIMSLLLLLGALLERAGAPARRAEALGPRRVGWVLAGLLFYSLALAPLGFVPATFVLLSALVKILGQRGWLAAMMFSLCATAGSYALFSLWLGVPLPRGHLFP